MSNPYEDYSTSKKPVAFGEVPIFSEMPLSAGERIQAAAPFLLILMLYTLVMFVASYVLFMRYDPR